MDRALRCFGSDAADKDQRDPTPTSSHRDAGAARASRPQRGGARGAPGRSSGRRTGSGGGRRGSRAAADELAGLAPREHDRMASRRDCAGSGRRRRATRSRLRPRSSGRWRPWPRLRTAPRPPRSRRLARIARGRPMTGQPPRPRRAGRRGRRASELRVHLDELTGAHGEDLERRRCRREIDRARRCDGHAGARVHRTSTVSRRSTIARATSAGDRLLRDVVAAIRQDPLLRADRPLRRRRVRLRDRRASVWSRRRSASRRSESARRGRGRPRSPSASPSCDPADARRTCSGARTRRCSTAARRAPRRS